MDELNQFDKVIEGFKNITKRIESLNYQDEEDYIKEELELLKKFSKDQIVIIGHFKKTIETIGIEEIKNRFGKERLKQDLKNCTNVLKMIEDQLLLFEALVKDSSKIIH